MPDRVPKKSNMRYRITDIKVTLLNALKTASLASSEKLATIAANEKLLVIKHSDLFKVEKGVKKVENWLFVKHASGILGYVKADEVSFKNIEHAPVLHEYYAKTPLLKQLWKSKAEFLSIKKF